MAMATVNSATFFGFALAASMFEGDGDVSFKQVSPEEAKRLVAEAQASGELQSCCNPSHVPTIDAMRARFGIDVPIPEQAPFAKLAYGDRIIVMGVRGLPRLQDGRHEYTEEEIASATFSFSVWRRTK